MGKVVTETDTLTIIYSAALSTPVLSYHNTQASKDFFHTLSPTLAKMREKNTKKGK